MKYGKLYQIVIFLDILQLQNILVNSTLATSIAFEYITSIIIILIILFTLLLLDSGAEE